jgi:serine O-acetyltransferase
MIYVSHSGFDWNPGSYLGANMIQSYEDYLAYLEADRIALGVKGKRPALIGDDEWKIERKLRKLEYYENCKNTLIWKPYIIFQRYQFYRACKKMLYFLPRNACGPGLALHREYIGINPGAKIGKNCRIHSGVIIGTQAGYHHLAPTIGDNVYIGPGAKLFGDIRIASGIAIGANAVVTKSFDDENITIAGVPAKKISDKGSKGLI